MYSTPTSGQRLLISDEEEAGRKKAEAEKRAEQEAEERRQAVEESSTGRPLKVQWMSSGRPVDDPRPIPRHSVQDLRSAADTSSGPLFKVFHPTGTGIAALSFLVRDR